MIEYFINIGGAKLTLTLSSAWIIISLIIYAIVINKVNTGRCFRYEYLIKSIIILGAHIVIFTLLTINSFLRSFFVFIPQIFLMFSFPSFLILIFFFLKYTIQRFYDLGLSGWRIILTLIPFFGIFVILYLFIKKSNCRINQYDKAINYKKLFSDRHCIDICDNTFIVNNEEYQYGQYLGKYTIKISSLGKENFFTEYLLKNYPSKEERIHRTAGITYKVVEITEDDFCDLIKQMNIIVIKNSFYVRIKGFEVFIRKEDFKYTIILDKNMNEVSKELFKTFDFPGSFYEDEENIYYIKVDKRELLMWVKNVA
jgi:uncharacterized membrane protein YhaH (DUF805 family)